MCSFTFPNNITRESAIPADDNRGLETYRVIFGALGPGETEKDGGKEKQHLKVSSIPALAPPGY